VGLQLLLSINSDSGPVAGGAFATMQAGAVGGAVVKGSALAFAQSVAMAGVPAAAVAKGTVAI